MESIRGSSPRPRQTSGTVCPASVTRPPLDLVSAVSCFDRHPRPCSIATHLPGGNGEDSGSFGSGSFTRM